MSDPYRYTSTIYRKNHKEWNLNCDQLHLSYHFTYFRFYVIFILDPLYPGKGHGLEMDRCYFVSSDMPEERQVFLCQTLRQFYSELGNTPHMYRAIAQAMENQYGRTYNVIAGESFGASIHSQKTHFAKIEYKNITFIVLKYYFCVLTRQCKYILWVNFIF